MSTLGFGYTNHFPPPPARHTDDMASQLPHSSSESIGDNYFPPPPRAYVDDHAPYPPYNPSDYPPVNPTAAVGYQALFPKYNPSDYPPPLRIASEADRPSAYVHSSPFNTCDTLVRISPCEPLMVDDIEEQRLVRFEPESYRDVYFDTETGETVFNKASLHRPTIHALGYSYRETDDDFGIPKHLTKVNLCCITVCNVC
jgi:hypothetical protein